MSTLKLKSTPFLSGFQLILILLIALALGWGWHTYEVKTARPAMAIFGVPHETSGEATNPFNQILRNKGFMLEYSQHLLNPLWVMYKVPQTHLNYGLRPRFEPDWRTLSRVSPKDYRGTHYDRGHNAPNYVIASRYGRAAQLDTFLMSNISPQKPNLNRKSWQRLEEISADVFSKQYPNLWVITGPIFSAHPKTLRHTSIAIPKAFYKIFLRIDANKTLHSLAFIFPQNAKSKANLMKFITNIDTIENQTGFDFFWQLPDPIENKLEQEENPKEWGFKALANRPGRY